MFKVGIIGLGAIGDRLINAFLKNEEVKIAAVCDTLEARLNAAAEKLEGTALFTNYKEMLEKAELDLVYVAVPPKFHHGIVLDVLDKKINVLCEKPLANSVEEAEEMMKKAEEAGVIHAMNFPLNYSSGPNTFARLIDEQYIGKLRRLELNLRFPDWPRLWQQNDWVASREQGGFVLEVGVHFIQLTQRIFGPVKILETSLEFPENPDKSEIGIVARGEFEDGTPFVVNGLSGIAGEENISYTAYGTEGTLSLLNWQKLEGGKVGGQITSIPEDESLSSTLIDNVVKALKGEDDAVLFNFIDGYNAQVVLEALRRG